ncbi:hypothetical protein M405DRAFT_14889 [Rhizopogon salebrosus TDB-379]|nr:hypothetical protein M405DRAFT_14889 [Rhizopogon salebrosus TDB-379]
MVRPPWMMAASTSDDGGVHPRLKCSCPIMVRPPPPSTLHSLYLVMICPSSQSTIVSSKCTPGSSLYSNARSSLTSDFCPIQRWRNSIKDQFTCKDLELPCWIAKCSHLKYQLPTLITSIRDVRTSCYVSTSGMFSGPLAFAP